MGLSYRIAVSRIALAVVILGFGFGMHSQLSKIQEARATQLEETINSIEEL